MSKFTARDLGFSVLTGLITGLVAWKIFSFLNIAEFHGIPWAALIIIVPILWIVGVMLGYFLGQWMPFFNQFGKFAAIGFTNAAVDFGVLNLLIAFTGYTAGTAYTVFKGLSFLSATLPSYYWNKHWAFNASNSSGKFEFGKFFIVALVSIFINTGVATLVVNHIHPMFNLTPPAWANVGAIAGSAAALIFSFLGFKLAVFKR